MLDIGQAVCELSQAFLRWGSGSLSKCCLPQKGEEIIDEISTLEKWSEHMELVEEIDGLLDAIEKELELLDRVTAQFHQNLDSQATQDMTRWLSSWKPFENLPRTLG